MCLKSGTLTPISIKRLFKMILFSFRSRKQTQNNAFPFAPPIFWDTSQKNHQMRLEHLILFLIDLLRHVCFGLTGFTDDHVRRRNGGAFRLAVLAVIFFSQEMASPIGIDLIRRMHVGTFAKEKQRATWVSTQIPCRTISYLQMTYWCTPFWFFHPSTLSCHPFHGGLRAGKSC